MFILEDGTAGNTEDAGGGGVAGQGPSFTRRGQLSSRVGSVLTKTEQYYRTFQKIQKTPMVRILEN